MPEDIEFSNAGPVTESITVDQAAGKMGGLFASVVEDAHKEGLWRDEGAPERQAPQRQAREPAPQEEPEDTPPAASEEPEAEAPPEENEQPDDDGPQPVAIPPGLSKAEREKFLTLSPQQQEAVAEFQRQTHAERSAAGREAAERAKALEAERQAIAAERGHYAQNLKVLIPTLQAQADEFKAVDWAKMAQDDPAGYVVKLEQARQKNAQLAMARAESERIELQTRQEAERQHMEFLKAERTKLEDALPDFRDGRKRQKLVNDLRDTLLKDYGFDAADVDGLADSRMFRVAHDAMQWRRAQAARATAPKADAPRPIRPGAPPQPPSSKRVADAQQRLGKTGSVDDAANVFKALKIFG